MRSLAALLFTGAAAILLVSYHWQNLPERVATHFDASGAVDRWMSRDTHFFLATGLIVGLTCAFYLIGALIGRVPQKWINLPNKAYWFSADRENQTRAYLTAWCWGFGALLNVFFLFIFHMVYLANTSDPPTMSNSAMLTGLVVYLVGALGSVVVLLVRFGTGR